MDRLTLPMIGLHSVTFALTLLMDRDRIAMIGLHSVMFVLTLPMDQLTLPMDAIASPVLRSTGLWECDRVNQIRAVHSLTALTFLAALSLLSGQHDPQESELQHTIND